MALDNGHWRPIVDCGEIVKALDIEYKRWKDSTGDKDIRTDCIDYVNQNFLWPDKIDLLKKIFTKALSAKSLAPAKQKPVVKQEPVLKA